MGSPVDARRVEAALLRKVSLLGDGDIRLAVAAREGIIHARPDTLYLTAADIFARDAPSPLE